MTLWQWRQAAESALPVWIVPALVVVLIAAWSFDSWKRSRTK